MSLVTEGLPGMELLSNDKRPILPHPVRLFPGSSKCSMPPARNAILTHTKEPIQCQSLSLSQSDAKSEPVWFRVLPASDPSQSWRHLDVPANKVRQTPPMVSHTRAISPSSPACHLQHTHSPPQLAVTQSQYTVLSSDRSPVDRLPAGAFLPPSLFQGYAYSDQCSLSDWGGLESTLIASPEPCPTSLGTVYVQPVSIVSRELQRVRRQQQNREAQRAYRQRQAIRVTKAEEQVKELRQQIDTLRQDKAILELKAKSLEYEVDAMKAALEEKTYWYNGSQEVGFLQLE
jgi:hypothetical protein